MGRNAGFVTTLILACGLHFAARAADNGAAAGFLAAHPGARATQWNGRVIALSGAPLSQGASAAQAANEFVTAGVAAFGVGPVDVRATRVTSLSSGRHTVFVYDQKMDGLSVEHGTLRVVTLAETVNDAFGQRPVHRAILARAMLAEKPADGFAPDTVDAQGAVDRVKALAAYADLTDWSQPEMVVYFGAGEMNALIEPVRAWKFRGDFIANRAAAKGHTFFVNAADGSLVFARDEVLDVNVSGRIVGLATGGSFADAPVNPPVIHGLPEMKVTIAGSSPSAFAYTDRDGNFSIPWSGSEPVNLQVSVGDAGSGRWVRVFNEAGPELSVLAPVNPGTSPNVNIHPVSTEATLAQVNAFIHVTRTHDFFKDLAPTFTGLNLETPTFVQIDAQCNAFFSSGDLSVNFFASSPICANTAFSSIVNHEYGHLIVNRLGLIQEAFGEGFGDAISILMHDDPVIGRGFLKPSSPVRDTVLDNVQYPCGGEIHLCGEVLAGIIWEVRNGFVTRHGSPAGLDMVRQLFVDWALITDGGIAPNSAIPAMLDEFLALDEDDSVSCNGTPNYRSIVNAFAAHGITGAAAIEDRAQISLPLGAPSSIVANQPWILIAQITPQLATLTPGTARALFRVGNDGPFTSVPMVSLGDDQYAATLDPVNCGGIAEYSFAVDTNEGTVTFPAPPCSAFTSFSATAADSVVSLSFPFDQNSGNFTGTLTSLGSGAAGSWIRALPAGSWYTASDPDQQVAPDDDANPAAGGVAFVTQQTRIGGTWSSDDIDNARVTLTSPLWNLANALTVNIGYARWFVNGVAADNSDRHDQFRVEVSNDSGVTWVPFETIGPGSTADPNTNAGWIGVFKRLDEVGLSPTSGVRLRFIAEDAAGTTQNPAGAVEAGVDDVSVNALVCIACDSIDFNNDEVMPDTADLFDYLAVFSGAPCPTGQCNDIDFNNDGLDPDSTDLFDYLRVFAGGPC